MNLRGNWSASPSEGESFKQYTESRIELISSLWKKMGLSEKIDANLTQLPPLLPDISNPANE